MIRNSRTRTRNWSWLAALTLLGLASAVGPIGHAAAEPAATHSELRIETGRIMQQRSGAMDKREPPRAAQAKKVDEKTQQRNRVELERQQQRQRAGQAEKRR